MASSLTVVAIPHADDYVWKLSSEQVPHMTLMYLGEDDGVDLDDMVSFVAHTVETTMCRFGMEVERRGILGPEDADVLFFSDHGRDKLDDFRSALLSNNNIYKAYNTTEQYPKFIPHLTMGYPKTPAHKDDREYPGVHWVGFDRIAFWIDDYDGPEFLLKDNQNRELIMSDVIEHYGVRGMRWGVRRARRVHETASTDAKTASNAYAKLKKHGIHTLSNNEIRSIVERMNLERQYSSIAPQSKSKRAAKAAAKFSGDVLVGVGKQQATKIVSGHADKLLSGLFHSETKSSSTTSSVATKS